MPVFKITFVNNEPVSCTPAQQRTLSGRFKYEHHRGALIFALVEAADETEAMKIVPQIVEEFKKEQK